MKDTRIAVIGIGLRYPSAADKQKLHEMLSQGIAAPADQQQARGELLGIADYEKLIHNIRCLEDIDVFDNSFFGIVKQEAMEMPPEMRLSLVCAAEAVMDAGLSINGISKRNCGAVISHSVNSYRKLLAKNTFLSFFNAMPGMTCGYLSHYLRLTGPSYHLDSTCSSSMTAVVNACNHLLMGQADLMIAGGVQNCIPLTPQDSKDIFSSVLSLGSDQECVPFDENANGFYNGEGAGFLLLERYEDAIKNGSHIYGVITGYGMCSNSDYEPTIYSPSFRAQNAAMIKAWEMAGVTANDITEFEAHGAATKYGDAAEIQNLILAAEKRTIEKPIALTAVKSNLGHTSSAAGVTSLIKVLLEFENSMIYPIAGFKAPSPNLDFKAAHAEPVAEKILLKKDERRVVDIGSYGLNELNVHIIMENPIHEDKNVSCRKNSGESFLKCSAASEDVLKNYLQIISEEIKHCNDNEFEDIIYTLNTGRDDFAYRSFIRYASREELIEKLAGEVPVIKCRQQKEEIMIDDLELAEREYLSGKGIDFSFLYRKKKFRRISTVLYPFAKKHIWPIVSK